MSALAEKTIEKYARIILKMSNMPFDTFLPLKQTAMLSIAERFWNLPQMKKRVAKFVKDSVGIHHVDARHRWMALIEELLAAWITYTLPLDLERHLLYAIKEIGRRTFDWFEWIKSQDNYRIPREYTVEDAIMFVSSIRWTPCGIVDEFETYQKISEMNPNFDISILYRVACMHAMEGQINYLWRRMSEPERKSLEYSINLDNDYMVAYWKYCRDNNLNALKASFRPFQFLRGSLFLENRLMKPYFSQSYDENLSVDENMMLASMYLGLVNSVRYFWDRLPEDHKNEKLFDYLLFTLMIYVDYRVGCESLENYRRERLARVCVFFISQMNDDHKEIFQRTTTATAILEETHKINVSRMEWLLRPAWPWDNFVSQGFKDLIHRRKFPTRLANILLREVTRSEAEQFRRGLVVNGTEIQSLIQDIWKSIPRNQTRYMIEPWVCPSNYNGGYFISNLIDARDFETLRKIVNESGSNKFRYQLVRDVLKMGESLIKTDDYELLEKLINRLAKSSEERLSFRRHVDCLEYFVNREEYDLADKLVDWKCWEPQMNEYTKMLRVMDLKDRFKDRCDAVTWVYALWAEFSTNIDEAMQRSSRFINWVFMTKLERDQFVKQNLATGEVKDILRNLKLSTEVIAKFNSWCELAQEEPLYKR